MDTIFNYLQQKIVQGAAGVLTSLSAVSIDIFSNETVINLLNFMEWIGYILLAVGILFAIANVYLQYVEDGSFQPHLLILNIIKSLIAIIFLQSGTIAMFSITTTIQKLLAMIITMTKYEDIVTVIVNVLSTDLNDVVWALIIEIIALVSIIVVLVQCAKRSGIYLIQILVGYLYIFGLPSGNTDGFFIWGKQTVALAFTNAVQIGLLMLGMKLMTNTMESVFLGIGVILSATSVDRVAGQFGMSVNSRQSIGSAVRTVQQTTQLVSAISRVM